MRKYEVLSKLEATGVIAVVRAKNAGEAKKIALACMEGGVTGDRDNLYRSRRNQSHRTAYRGIR